MSKLHSHFSAISPAPKAAAHHSLFSAGQLNSAHQSNGISDQLTQLARQVSDQSSLLSALAGQLGKSTGSGLQGALGGSVLGEVAGAATGGFSLGSLFKDILPLGGLISGIVGLFSSAPTPPPLQQYDAPVSLNFDAVLGSDGSLSQGSTDQYGKDRASSPGLNLVDAAGGPYSPYQRAANGSLVQAAGDAVTKYSGDLNLQTALAALTKRVDGQTQAPAASAPAPQPAPVRDDAQQNANTNLTAEASNNPAAAVPTFDANWFNDHGSMIASAVRNQMLNFHPIVDAINDL